MALEKRFSTDWLASTPVFYNAKTGAVSYSFNDVIDFSDLQFDPEGFNNYLDFGYSVYGQTPVKDVKFLRHSSEIVVQEDGTYTITEHDDPTDDMLGIETTPEEVLSRITDAVQAWEASQSGDLVIPTSGGFDSRLLNLCVRDTSRIRSFTYGISSDQGSSSEIVYARELSRILGTSWEAVRLGNYHDALQAWDDLFGASVHAHGMYHIEFYDEIEKRIGTGKPLLSGIIGDAWAGSVSIPPIPDPASVVTLGYSHGMRADSKRSLLKSDGSLSRKYFEAHKDKLKDSRARVIESMRFKMMLLTYLFRVPASLGFKPWSPFLDMAIALSMLNLPASERRDRKWQRDFFREKGVSFEDLPSSHDSGNTLMLEAIERSALPLLDPLLFSGLIERQYIEEINAVISRSARSLARKRARHELLSRFYKIPYLENLALRLRLDSYHLRNAESRAYYAYVTLKPIENLIKKRHGTH